jgi:glycosyltransferase involved in cell wall biosynthesis
MAFKLWRSAPPPVPRVSVVIPLYNHARFIAEAVESAIAQGDLVREIVVVDDGSIDESAVIMQRLCDRESRIVFWSQPNRGAHAAINAGLQRATGDLVAILNSDDAYLPDRLPALVATLASEPAADIAASGLVFVNEAGEAIDNPWYEAARGFYRSCGDLATALINGNFLMTTSNYLFRRSLLDEVGLFAPLRYMHDVDFGLRAIASGKRFALVDKPMLRYRMHSGNTIREDHGQVRMEWAVVAASFLASRWGRGQRGPIDWNQMIGVTDVLQRHQLLRAVQLCLMYLSHHPSDTLERSPLLADQEFRSALRNCL